MAYQLEGSLLEVCTCNILCPCWVGEDPDGGICEGVLAWNFAQGSINGTDVAGRTFVILAHIPGNILEGNWRVVVYVDRAARQHLHDDPRLTRVRRQGRQIQGRRQAARLRDRPARPQCSPGQLQLHRLSPMWPTVRDQRVFVTVLTGLVALSWASLWALGSSPYGQVAHTHGTGGRGLWIVYLSLAGWMLMIVAM